MSRGLHEICMTSNDRAGFDIEIANRDERPTVDEDLWNAWKKKDRRGRRMPKKPAAPLTVEGGK